MDAAIVSEEVPDSGLERARIVEEIWRHLVERGVDPFHPLEMHLLSPWEKELLEKGSAGFIDARVFRRGVVDAAYASPG